MKRSPWAKTAFSCAFALVSATAAATDYYVSSAEGASDNNDGLSAESPFATVDKAITSAADASDVIHVAAGTYATTTQYGPNLKAKLLGEGASRDDVVIESAGTYRTLRMAAGSWLEKVTVVGNTDISKADKGGAIEMSGGTVTNCVIRDGKAYGNSSKNAGGNLYVNANAALVVDCAISGGSVTNRGGNVCLDHGTLRRCTITGGSSVAGAESWGGNVFIYQGRVEDCAISGGSSERAGNIYVYDPTSVVTNSTISGGTVSNYGGNLFMRNGTLIDSLVTNGTAKASGGNVYIQAGTIRDTRLGGGSTLNNEGGSVYMTGGSLSNILAVCNGSVRGSGGCVWMNNGTLADSTLVGGTAVGYYGGTLYMDGGVATNCVLAGGASSREGGNLYMLKGTAVAMDIRNGTAVNDGGNVRLKAGLLADSIVADGTITTGSQKKGANVYMDGTSALSRCHLSGGASQNGYDSGSLCVYSSSASVEDCLVEGGECGGALLGGTSYLYNCTIAGNEPYGIWSWTAVQHIYNTVIFGNIQEGATRDWAGNQPTSESAHFLNCAVTAGSLPTGTFPTLVELVQSDFADAANGNYRPSSGSSLIDAGMADPRGAEASITDLDGSLRTSGTIDIGCYEARKSEMVVHIDGADYSQAHAPAIVTFSHSTDNSASPENIVFTYNFGDGGTNVSTTAATISHEYAAPGVYTVTITADNACDDESATMVYEGYARVASSVVYVTPGNGAGTFPYDTAETGFGNIKTAVQYASDGYTLLLGTGVHETADQVSFSKGITLRGVGATPEAVIVRNTHVTPDTYYHRTLEMNNGDGRIENLTIENGCVRNQNGGNLRLVSGVVSNCVIRGGLAVADNGNAAGAAVEISGAGILTHCVISNNLVQGTSNNGSYAGGAIFIAYNAKGSRISNCLVAFNRYETSGDTVKAGAAGIRFGGSNDNTQIENNTVAANTVEGSLSDDSAGIHCTTWYGRLRNNLVIGNYETGKGKYTAVRMDVEHGTYTNNLTDENATTAVFKGFAAGDFRLNASGKANNAGSIAGLALLPSVDIAGKPRLFGSAIDVGCYECQAHARTMIILR